MEQKCPQNGHVLTRSPTSRVGRYSGLESSSDVSSSSNAVTVVAFGENVFLPAALLKVIPSPNMHVCKTTQYSQLYRPSDVSMQWLNRPRIKKKDNSILKLLKIHIIEKKQNRMKISFFQVHISFNYHNVA